MGTNTDTDRLKYRLERVMALRGLSPSGWSLAAKLSKNALGEFFNRPDSGAMKLPSLHALAAAARVPAEALTLVMSDDHFAAWMAAAEKKAAAAEMLRQRAKERRVGLDRLAAAMGGNPERVWAILDGDDVPKGLEIGALSRLLAVPPQWIESMSPTPPAESAAAEAPAAFASDDDQSGGIDISLHAMAMIAIRQGREIMGLGPLPADAEAEAVARMYNKLANFGRRKAK